MAAESSKDGWIQFILFRTYGMHAAERLALVFMVYRMNDQNICSLNPATLAPALGVSPSEALAVMKSLEDQRYITLHDKINGETFYVVTPNR